MKDLWGTTIISLLLSNPHLPLLWVTNSRRRLTLIRLEIGFEHSILQADNLPVTNVFGDFLTEALHPSPLKRLGAKTMVSRLAAIPLNSVLQTQEEIMEMEQGVDDRTRRSWFRSTYNAARIMYLIPSKHVPRQNHGEADAPPLYDPRTLLFYRDIHPRAIILKEGYLQPLYMLVNDTRLTYWAKEICPDTFLKRKGLRLESEREDALLDWFACEIAQKGPHMLRPVTKYGEM